MSIVYDKRIIYTETLSDTENSSLTDLGMNTH